MSNEIVAIDTTLAEIETDFNGIAKEHGEIKWETEFNFSMQALQGNDYLRKIAIGNKESLRNAVVNLAATGLSLNPANKHAYLVPRDGAVRLDISYMGLVHLACKSGALKWVQAQVVKVNDSFEIKGVGQKPEHGFSPLSDRGAVTGAYCVAKTEDGEYLTEVMSIAEICDIRDRSTAFKKSGKGPWKTDFEEMAKKTVIKRASKLWPKNDKRIMQAVNITNETEGIDFDSEKVVELISGGQMKQIQESLEVINRTEKEFLPYLSTIEKREITEISALTKEGATRALGIIRGIIANQKNKQSEIING